ncbi:hypothetical protein [Azoarcus sp. DN11]|uniref:hypothetical protein n=1 Tax=Azoarcus sp. DN11 TaxID=356837 RepID=UPI0013E30209|nr:hypothetical protein [Azoarcus sp. DN11]
MDARVDDHGHPMCQGYDPVGRGLLVGLVEAHVTSLISWALARPMTGIAAPFLQGPPSK